MLVPTRSHVLLLVFFANNGEFSREGGCPFVHELSPLEPCPTRRRRRQPLFVFGPAYVG